MLRVAQHAEKTDVGMQRQANEDNYIARSPLFVVADGMGGAQAGEVASQSAVDVFRDGLPDGVPEATLQQMIGVANRTIHDMAVADSSLSGMGTTITAAFVNSEREEVVVGHVGDSRAYRLRNGILQRLTRDHSLVEEMRRRGQITEEQAEDHPQRSIITRALGPEPEVEVDIQAVPAEPGDIFLLCSDGLTTMMNDERLRELVNGATSLDAAVKTLVDEANRAGGRDNITVSIFQVEDPENPLPRGEGPTLIAPASRRSQQAAGIRDRRPKPKRRLGSVLAKVAVGLVALVVLFGGMFYASHQVWFLGTDDGGRVALYQGLPYELPFGINLYQEKYASPIQTSELSQQGQDSVRGHKLRKKDDATSLIEDIETREGL